MNKSSAIYNGLLAMMLGAVATCQVTCNADTSPPLPGSNLSFVPPDPRPAPAERESIEPPAITKPKVVEVEPEAKPDPAPAKVSPPPFRLQPEVIEQLIQQVQDAIKAKLPLLPPVPGPPAPITPTPAVPVPPSAVIQPPAQDPGEPLLVPVMQDAPLTQPITPPPMPIVQRPLQVTTVTEQEQPDPVTVTVLCPEDAIVGDRILVHATITGDVRFVKWTVKPEVSGITHTPDKLIITFTNRRKGTYIFTCHVSGPTGLDAASAEITILPDPDAVSIQIQQPQAQVQPPPQPTQPTPQPQQQPNVSQGPPPQPQQMAQAPQAASNQVIERYVVNSVSQLQNKLAITQIMPDCGIVASSFGTTISALQSGTFPANTNPYDYIRNKANMALGNTSASWKSFFDDIQNLLATIQQQGQLMTMEQYIDVLSKVHAALAKIAPTGASKDKPGAKLVLNQGALQ